MTDYDIFDYYQPSEPANVYGANALKILSEIKRDFSDEFHNFAAPSEVLTLSGVRAFDTYYELKPDKDNTYKQKLRDLLIVHGVLFVDETLPFIGEENKENRYSLVHLRALEQLPQTYRHMPFWLPFNHQNIHRDSDFYAWWMFWRDGFHTHGEEWQNGILHEWLSKYLPVAHDVTFGMLLGYPGEAIVGAIVDQTDGSHKMTDAKILHADKYDGAQPVYCFPSELADDPAIVAHQKLWSDILGAVYRDPLFVDEN